MAKSPRTFRCSELFNRQLADCAKWLPAENETHALHVAVERLHQELKKERKNEMSSQERIAQDYANSIIAQLQESEEGFISAEMVDWRNSGGYCEPRIRMTTESGVWEAWARDGQSVRDMQWEEIA